MASKPPRCIWTGRRSPHARRIEYEALDRFAIDTRQAEGWILPEHEDAFRRFNAFAIRWAQTFLMLAFALAIVALVAAILGAVLWVGIAVAGIGLLVVVFPFATPETVAFLGQRSAIRLARTLGAITAALGLAVAALAAFWAPA